MNRCSKCGKEIPSDSVFCPFCGQALAVAHEEPKYRQNTSPQPERSPKYRLPMPTGKFVFLAASVLFLILMILYAIFRMNIVFGSFDPNTINPYAGRGVISYDLDTKKYTKEYLSKVSVANTPSGCGYIVKYQKRMENSKDLYHASNSSIVTSVKQEVIDVEIYSVRKGETIAKTTFRAFLPWETKNTYFYVDEWKVENWIAETIESN